MEFINNLIASLENVLNGSVLVSVAFVLEMVLRLVPTEKPKSLMLALSSILKGCSKIFDVAALIIDKVIPQRLK